MVQMEPAGNDALNQKTFQRCWVGAGQLVTQQVQLPGQGLPEQQILTTEFVDKG